MVMEQLQEMKQTLDLSAVVAGFNTCALIPPQRVAGSLRLSCEQVGPGFK